MEIKYSVIVPVSTINEYIFQHVKNFSTFSRDDIELIILPNDSSRSITANQRVRLISTGVISPARKRDFGVYHARGSYLVFLDDDSFVAEEYFSELDSFYSRHNNSAVGGPAVTPPESSVLQLASGAIYESRILSSNPERYVPIMQERNVNDWPSVNLSLPKRIFLTVGGFGSEFWPGEDTYFCLKLYMAGISIRYLPTLVAYHHRRSTALAHLRQAANYGLHRGNFARHHPENSRYFRYFLPSLLTIYSLCLLSLLIILGLFWVIGASFPVPLEGILKIGSMPGFVYITMVVISSFSILRRHSLRVSLHTLYLFPATHIIYGFFFLKGIINPQLIKSKLR